jgi:hypothetical protein
LERSSNAKGVAMPRSFIAALILGCVVSISWPSYAQDDLKQKKLHELMEVLGFADQLKKQIAGLQGKDADTEKMLAPLLQQLQDLEKTLPPPEPGQESFGEQLKASEESSKKLLESVASMLNPEKAMKVWSEAYGQDMTIEDLDAIIAYYKSPLGQKDLAAQRKASEHYLTFVLKETFDSQGDFMKTIQQDLEKSKAKFEESMKAITKSMEQTK